MTKVEVGLVVRVQSCWVDLADERCAAARAERDSVQRVNQCVNGPFSGRLCRLQHPACLILLIYTGRELRTLLDQECGHANEHPCSKRMRDVESKDHPPKTMKMKMKKRATTVTKRAAKKSPGFLAVSRPKASGAQ
jgi:hypothetical protein